MSKFIKTAAAVVVFGAFSTVTMAGGGVIKFQFLLAYFHRKMKK